jgi:hypothetical protein
MIPALKHLVEAVDNARREREKKSGRKVVTIENHLALTQAAKQAK